MELNDNINKGQKTYDELSKKITEMEFKIDNTDEEIQKFEKENPDLVKIIREEEKKNLDDEEMNSISRIGINSIKNKEYKKEEKKEEKKEDENDDDIEKEKKRYYY